MTAAAKQAADAALADVEAPAAADSESECEQTEGDLRAGLDGSRVYQSGPTMVYVHDSFLNESEAAHLRGAPNVSADASVDTCFSCRPY